MVILLLGLALVTLLTGAAWGSKRLRPDAKRIYIGAALLAAPLSAAALLRIEQDAPRNVTALVAILFVGAQILALLAPKRVLWLAAAVLPTAGIALGAARSTSLAALLSIPLAILVSLSAPVSVRAIAQAKADGDRSGPLLFVGITLLLGAVFGSIFLGMRLAP